MTELCTRLVYWQSFAVKTLFTPVSVVVKGNNVLSSISTDISFSDIPISTVLFAVYKYMYKLIDSVLITAFLCFYDLHHTPNTLPREYMQTPNLQHLHLQ